MSSVNKKHIALALVLAFVAGAITYLESDKPVRSPMAGAGPSLEAGRKTLAQQLKAARFRPAQEISSPDGFLNTGTAPDGAPLPIAVKDLIGKKVVLVDFWTYSCINCQRTIPYLNAWHEKYADSGLVIIGMHTPEFSFEKKYENVAAAVKKFGIKYPVVLDNDYSTWQAYENNYWPRKYLIDIDGYIVYDHVGEGGYEETEQKIQELLAERMQTLNMQGEVNRDISRPTDAVELDISKPRSPEIYFGASRNEYLANGKGNAEGESAFAVPAELKPNMLYLDGTWTVTDEFAENRSAGARVLFRYQGKNVYMVARSDAPVRAKILVDGKPIAAGAGTDVIMEKGMSYVTFQEDRLYTLIEDVGWTEGHVLEIIPEAPGLQAFTFTFG